MFRGIVNTIKSSVGVGVYSIPFMMVCVGPTFGAALLILVVFTSCFCVEQLVEVRHTFEARRRSVMVSDALGDSSGDDFERSVRPKTTLPSSTPLTGTVGSSESSSDDTASVPAPVHMQEVVDDSVMKEESDRDRQRNTYPNLAFQSLGTAGRWCTITSLWLAMYGSLISYVIFTKQNLVVLIPALQPYVRRRCHVAIPVAIPTSSDRASVVGLHHFVAGIR